MQTPAADSLAPGLELPTRGRTPGTPQEHHLPNHLKYYNEHLNKTQFNLILVACAVRLLGLLRFDSFDEAKLRFFIVELLRRSKTTTQLLQICCYYIFRAINRGAEPAGLCPKKFFLGMLILASKFNQDHNYSFKSWLKVCGCGPDTDQGTLNLQKLRQAEARCLLVLDYRLYINGVKYENWCNVLLIFGYDFIAQHQVQLGELTWCTAGESTAKLERWRAFLVRLDDTRLAETKVNFKQYYANQIGTKVLTSQPCKSYKRPADDEPLAKRLCT